MLTLQENPSTGNTVPLVGTTLRQPCSTTQRCPQEDLLLEVPTLTSSLPSLFFPQLPPGATCQRSLPWSLLLGTQPETRMLLWSRQALGQSLGYVRDAIHRPVSKSRRAPRGLWWPSVWINHSVTLITATSQTHVNLEIRALHCSSGQGPPPCRKLELER